MDNYENRAPAFAAADLDIDMIDKLHTPATNSASVGTTPAELAEMARRLAAAIEGLTRQQQESESQRRQLEQRLQQWQEGARAYEGLRGVLQSVADLALSEDDITNLNRVVAALAKDPNHIMVLASVAQQAQKLQTLVTAFGQLYTALKATSSS